MSAQFQFRINVLESFWLIPFLMGIAGIILSQLLIMLDQYIVGSGAAASFGELGVEGGRGILTAIAGSVLGVAATSFSITTAVLATASTTYGPRLVRNFMADKRNQTVLGSFVATFLYSLLVMRAIDAPVGGSEAFVPSLAINLAIILSMINVALLIYFIHHISNSVQISTLISRVRNDLTKSVESLYGEKKQEKGTTQKIATRGEHSEINAWSDGFVVWIDYDGLISAAKEHDATVELLVEPGDYVYSDITQVARVWHGSDDDGWVKNYINTGESRTPYQDIRYAIQLPVDIAVRALSPGTNDPYTAINALKGLGSGFTRLVQYENVAAQLADDKNTPRLLRKVVSIEDLIEGAFQTLRGTVIDAVDATTATIDLAESIANVSQHTSYKITVTRAIESIASAYEASDATDADKRVVAQRVAKIAKK